MEGSGTIENGTKQNRTEQNRNIKEDKIIEQNMKEQKRIKGNKIVKYVYFPFQTIKVDKLHVSQYNVGRFSAAN